MSADRDAGQVRLTEYVLLTEKCTERNCGTRTRYSELTDDLNTHWHVKPGMALLAARQSDPDATERVEWQRERAEFHKARAEAAEAALVADHQGKRAEHMEWGVRHSDNFVAGQFGSADGARGYIVTNGGTLVRRTVTTGEWEAVNE